MANVNYDGHSVSVTNTRTNTVTTTISTSEHTRRPWPGTRRPPPHGHAGNGTVSVINTESMTVTGIPTGKSPTSVAVDPSGQTAYVTNSGPARSPF